MTKYLAAFPAAALAVPAEDFGLVAASGTVGHSACPQTKAFNGGFRGLRRPPHPAAVPWAATIAKAGRCAQELREFGDDPES